jgi:hypothetical protein
MPRISTGVRENRVGLTWARSLPSSWLLRNEVFSNLDRGRMRFAALTREVYERVRKISRLPKIRMICG